MYYTQASLATRSFCNSFSNSISWRTKASLGLYKKNETKDTGPAPRCYPFDGGSGDSLNDNCDYILDQYPLLLDTSFGVSIVCLMIVSIFTVLTIISLYMPTIFEPEYYKKRAELEQMSRNEYEKLKKQIMKEDMIMKNKKILERRGRTNQKNVDRNDDKYMDGDNYDDDDDSDIVGETSRGAFYQDNVDDDNDDDDTSVESDDVHVRRSSYTSMKSR